MSDFNERQSRKCIISTKIVALGQRIKFKQLSKIAILYSINSDSYQRLFLLVAYVVHIIFEETLIKFYIYIYISERNLGSIIVGYVVQCEQKMQSVLNLIMHRCLSAQAKFSEYKLTLMKKKHQTFILMSNGIMSKQFLRISFNSY